MLYSIAMKTAWLALLAAVFSLARVTALSAQDAALKVSAREPFLLDYARKAGSFSSAGLAVEVLISSSVARPGGDGAADAVLGEALGPLSAFLRGEDVRVLARLYPSYGFFGVSRFPTAEASKIKSAARGPFGGRVPGVVVDDDDLGGQPGAEEFADGGLDALLLVVGGQDDR